MIYTEWTKKAIQLSFEAHKNQLDKSGLPYVYHPFHVAESMTNEAATVTALLHDVVEDTAITMDDLKAYGFHDEILTAISLLTHDRSVDYMEYINRIKANPIARAVKIADLKHNSDLSRLNVMTEKDLKRIQKYKQAIFILETP